jgi:predicted RNA binding protein YcfA (HicA-like mRNA interferase family)
MSKLPQISGRECVKALTKAGFYFVRQKGSHMYIRRDEPFAQVSIPDHKELDKGTLKGILRQAGVTVDEFIALL